MPQFDVLRNLDPRTRERIPYLLDVQSGLLEALATRVVVPLCQPGLLKGLAAKRLTPVFQVEGLDVMMLTPQLAAVSRKVLGAPVANLTRERLAIVAALDMVFTGA
jgi:toxin CcdB